MYGITEGGNSVMAHIHNFLSYFYVELSEEFQDREWTNDDFMKIATSINGQLQCKAVAHIELKEKASVMFYQEKMNKFLKIYVHLPKSVNQCR